MQRSEWTFQFTGKRLSEAARKKKEFHESRLSFWAGAKEKVMLEVRETGIEVSESEAGANYTKSGYGPQVMVRADLQKKLTECHQKIQEHYGKINEYDGWVQILEANPDASLPLNGDDYLYFFGK